MEDTRDPIGTRYTATCGELTVEVELTPSGWNVKTFDSEMEVLSQAFYGKVDPEWALETAGVTASWLEDKAMVWKRAA